MTDVALDSVGHLWRTWPHTFAERVSDPHLPPGKWKAAPHLKLISTRIVRNVARGNSILLIMIHSGSGKSLLSSVWTPTWFLENWPEKKVACVSYGLDLALSWGRIVRDQFKNNHQLHTPLNEDAQAAGRWITEAGGGMKSVGIGGDILGFRPDLIIIDDPHRSWEDAMNPDSRDKVWRFFKSTLWSRREPGATIIVLMQRFHPQDLCGRIMSEFGSLPGVGDGQAVGLDVLRLPALAEPNDPLGRKEGEALWPARMPVAQLLVTKALDAYVWDAMWQQKPRSEVHGRAYEKFTDAPHPLGNVGRDFILRPDLPLTLALDFNVNPGMHALLGQYDRRTDFGGERYEIHGPRMKTEGVMAAFAAWVEKYGFPFPELIVYGDRSGRSETTNTTDTDYDIIIRMLRELSERRVAAGHREIKFRFDVPEQNPPIKSRVLTLNDALQDGDGTVHCVVHPDCTRLLEDMRTQAVTADGLPDESNQLLGHAASACGYKWFRVRPLHNMRIATARMPF